MESTDYKSEFKRDNQVATAGEHVASSPGLQLCRGKAWYRLHAHAVDFRILCRKIVRKRKGPLYPYVFGFCRFCRMLAHAHAVNTRPSLRLIEGLGTRLVSMTLYMYVHVCMSTCLRGKNQCQRKNDVYTHAYVYIQLTGSPKRLVYATTTPPWLIFLYP